VEGEGGAEQQEEEGESPGRLGGGHECCHGFLWRLLCWRLPGLGVLAFWELGSDRCCLGDGKRRPLVEERLLFLKKKV